MAKLAEVLTEEVRSLVWRYERLQAAASLSKLPLMAIHDCAHPLSRRRESDWAC